MKHKNTAIQIAIGGLLTAVTLVLGYVESMIPLGAAVPGIKIGLSNAVLLYALYMLGARQAFFLMLLKVLLSGLLFGGVSAIMFSLAGGIASMLLMLLVRRIPGMGIIGVSVAGAVFHNIGQVSLAMLILQTDKLLYYMAVLMLAGVAMGVLTGIVASAVMRAISKTGHAKP